MVLVSCIVGKIGESEVVVNIYIFSVMVIDNYGNSFNLVMLIVIV